MLQLFCPIPPSLPFLPPSYHETISWGGYRKQKPPFPAVLVRSTKSDLTMHTLSFEGLSYFPLPTFSCQFYFALRPGDPDFCFPPTDESSGLHCWMRWLALDGAPKDDVCYSLQHLVTMQPLCPSQGRWAAAEDLLQRSSPVASRARRWLSLTPEEQTGQVIAEAVN